MIKLSAAIIMMGSIFGLYKTEYDWPSYAIAGDTLYSVKTASTNAFNIPIPERGSTEVLRKDYKVVAIDLTGKKEETVSTRHRLIPERPVGDDHLMSTIGYYEYIELNDAAPPVLWGRKELKARLMQAAGSPCTEREFDQVLYDQQDSRVLYLHCETRDIAYRFELPAMEATPIPLGEATGTTPHVRPTFFSALGQKVVFAKINGVMLEIPLDAKDKAKKTEKIEGNFIGPERRSEKSLIGIAEGLRIYQLTQLQANTAQVSIEYDQQPLRIFSLPTAIVNCIAAKATYLPKNKLVMWEVRGEIKGKVVMYTLHIETGVTHRTVVSQVD
ncbi:hypothetical protein [Undibacterium squillarum]|uniref:hypothetical protein n=1 Tax=Undibacterium squillarum TaxID=1131567 RepID=UPI0035AF6A67